MINCEIINQNCPKSHAYCISCDEHKFKEITEERIKFHKDILKKFGLTEKDGTRTTEDLVNEEIEKIKNILKDGLDVGGIIKYIVKVRLEYYDGEWWFMHGRREGWRVFNSI